MDLYYNEFSCLSRSVLLTVKALGLNMNKKRVDLLQGEQLKGEFLAINFQHSLPTLVDGDLTLWESRAICTYLASQYGKDDSLYPKCPKERALVDRMIFFEMGTVFKRFGDYIYPVMFRGESPDKGQLAKVQEALVFLNKFLKDQDFAAGNHITIADNCLVPVVSSMVAAGIDISKYSNVVEWLERCKDQMPGYDSENAVGAKEFGALFKSKLSY